MSFFFASDPEFDRDDLLNLPSTWFKPKITLDQIRARFSKAEDEIRIASGFFTIKGYGLIRRYIQVGVCIATEKFWSLRKIKALKPLHIKEFNFGSQIYWRSLLKKIIVLQKVSHF
ncbi:hypothetical protein I4641_21085 [Waterburya agarophytonicola K14]|uniref:Uncharacterized protein n=1 Tax=Waterburya agarophytonicola KI4 TaxID=2874699 RepID=A0A964FLL8_9CYAN|nr:hypothetical protein [Waterburya agarophytonicola]MCC0179458.1 hypothetical protein [Waterburya agarophytonicola KI4]